MVIFETVFGLEKYGKVLCYGRNVTISGLKKNKEPEDAKNKNKTKTKWTNYRKPFKPWNKKFKA